MEYYLNKYLDFASIHSPFGNIPSRKTVNAFLIMYSDTHGNLYNAASLLREFSRYLIGFGYASTYVIPTEKISLPPSVRPYLFTDDEIAKFFVACDSIPYDCHVPRRNLMLPTMYIYHLSSDLIAVFPKDDNTKLLIRQAVTMLNTASVTVESLRQKMNATASTLPEYSIVTATNGIGPTLGPQFMAEIGDVTRFTHRGALTAFAGVDPGKNDSGQRTQKSVRTSKKGSPILRKTLFQIMDSLINRSPGLCLYGQKTGTG